MLAVMQGDVIDKHPTKEGSFILHIAVVSLPNIFHLVKWHFDGYPGF